MIRSRVGESFSEFFERWVSQLDEYLQQLLIVSKESVNVKVNTSSCCDYPGAGSSVASYEQEAQVLVSRVTQHYKEYYTKKWALAQEDVLAFYSPIWVTPLEVAYSWLTGWKPSTMLKVVDYVRRNRVPGPSLAELTQEQARKIEELRAKIRLEEEKMEMEMERQQVGLAGRKMVELARLATQLKDNDETTPAGRMDGSVNVALKGVTDGLERVMKGADCVRLKALKGVLDVLSPLQSVDFLAGGIIVQLKLRQQGKDRELENVGGFLGNN